MPSMGPTISVVNLLGQQNLLQKADQLAKPGNGTVNGWRMSVAVLAVPIKWDRPSVAIWSRYSKIQSHMYLVFISPVQITIRVSYVYRYPLNVATCSYAYN